MTAINLLKSILQNVGVVAVGFDVAFVRTPTDPPSPLVPLEYASRRI